LPFLDLGRSRATLDGGDGGDGQEIALCLRRKGFRLLCLTTAAKKPKTRYLLLESESMTCTVATVSISVFAIKIIFNQKEPADWKIVYVSVLWCLICSLFE
jgi:hypothetical protein